jgi:hypothetical protein
MVKRIRDRPIATAVLAIVVAQETERAGGRLSVAEKFRAAKTASDVFGVPVELAIAHANGAGSDGEWPTQQEYAAYWKVTERTAQRRWKLYREVMRDAGLDPSPYVLAKALFAEYSSRLADGDGSVAWEAPGSLLAAV